MRCKKKNKNQTVHPSMPQKFVEMQMEAMQELNDQDRKAEK